MKKNQTINSEINSNKIYESEIFYAEHKSKDYPVGVYYVEPEKMIMGDVRLHWHSETEIDYVKQGEAIFNIGEETVKVNEGQAIIINKDRIHSIAKSSSNCIILSVLFMPDFIFENNNSFLSLKYQNPLNNNSGYLYKIFDRDNKVGIDCINEILKINLEKKYGYELMTKSLLCHLWLLLLEYNKNIKGKPNELSNIDEQRVKEAIFYIHQNYSRELTLEQIASSIHLSKSECCRAFKRSTHMTPFEYLMRERIFESAIKMQRNDPICSSISELAKSVGFNNASYFNKIFKKYMGNTPIKCREEIQKRHRDYLSPFGISLSRL